VTHCAWRSTFICGPRVRVLLSLFNKFVRSFSDLVVSLIDSWPGVRSREHVSMSSPRRCFPPSINAYAGSLPAACAGEPCRILSLFVEFFRCPRPSPPCVRRTDFAVTLSKLCRLLCSAPCFLATRAECGPFLHRASLSCPVSLIPFLWFLAVEIPAFTFSIQIPPLFSFCLCSYPAPASDRCW